MFFLDCSAALELIGLLEGLILEALKASLRRSG